MAIGYFITNFKRDLAEPGDRVRYCAMQDGMTAIMADDGDWAETEILHTATPIAGGAAGKAIVRVRASVATLADLATVYRRLPKDALDDPLSSLTVPQRNALRGELEDCGYTLAEIQARFGNDIRNFTLRQVVEFATGRRRKPRYDAANDRIICDGIVQTCRDIRDVERRCFNDADWTRLKGIRDALMAEWDVTGQTIRLVQHILTASLPKWEHDAILVLCGQAGYYFDKIRPDTFPTTGVLDNFNRGDASTLGTNWSLFFGDGHRHGIVSNVAANQNGAWAGDYYNVATYGPDAELYITEVANPTTRHYIYVRVADPATGSPDGYGAAWNRAAANSHQIVRVDNGSYTALGANISQTLSVGNSVGIEVISTTITAEYNAGSWSALANRTDSTYSASGYLAIESETNGYQFDSFGGGTVVVGGYTPRMALMGVG